MRRSRAHSASFAESDLSYDDMEKYVIFVKFQCMTTQEAIFAKIIGTSLVNFSINHPLLDINSHQSQKISKVVTFDKFKKLAYNAGDEFRHEHPADDVKQRAIRQVAEQTAIRREEFQLKQESSFQKGKNSRPIGE